MKPDGCDLMRYIRIDRGGGETIKGEAEYESGQKGANRINKYRVIGFKIRSTESCKSFCLFVCKSLNSVASR
jgi:hypothetical protein